MHACQPKHICLIQKLCFSNLLLSLIISKMHYIKISQRIAEVKKKLYSLQLRTVIMAFTYNNISNTNNSVPKTQLRLSVGISFEFSKSLCEEF